MNFPTLSQIRFPKLIIQDVMNWIFNTNFPTVNGFASTFVMIWAFFAIQNKKYHKKP